ncbi:peptidylprolyl isomerase [Thermodesulfobacteriota bacterium]
MDKISSDKMVTLSYSMKLHFLDRTVKERDEERIDFIFGVDRQVPTLEKALEGVHVGLKQSLVIPATEIYGEHDPELIRELPKKGLIKQRLKAGQYYRQMKKGALVSFKILEIRPDTILADLNRPMAGIWLTMDTEVLAIRDATKREIDAAMESQVKRSIGCG